MRVASVIILVSSISLTKITIPNRLELPAGMALLSPEIMIRKAMTCSDGTYTIINNTPDVIRSNIRQS